MAAGGRKYAFDLFVIGAGSGGVRASRIAAQTGARVAICEESRVGGTCVIRGCIPKKLLAQASHYAEDFEDSHNFGWDLEDKRAFDWGRLISNKDVEIDRLNKVYINLLKNAGVSLVEGRGNLIDEHTVKVGSETYTAERILLATGARPYVPQFEGSDLVITSNEAFHLPSLPKKVAIVGGGYIACEFAGIFKGCGSDVTMIIRGPNLLRGFDSDVQSTLKDETIKRGIRVLTETTVAKIRRRLKQGGVAGGELECVVGGSSSTISSAGGVVDADAVLYATGRRPNVEGLGLERVGVALDENQAVVVDKWSQTNVPSIYAVGDITNRLNLTPVALAEGHAFADTVYGGKPRSCDHSGVPSAVFSHPPVGSVGLTEEQAKEKFNKVDVYISRFTPLKHTITKRNTKTMMKLVVDAATDKVLGVHMVGDDAPEIVQGFAVALKCGATKTQFDATIGLHPSAAEEFVTMRTKRQ